MIPRVARWAALGLLATLVATAPVHAQLESNLGALSGENAEGYLGPLSTALSGTMNAAIFQSGDVPKAGFGLNIGFKAMSVSFDDADRFYRPQDPPGFTSTEEVDASTVIGGTEAVEQPGEAGSKLYHPGGFDIENFGIAVPQLSIGSVAGTRAVVRFISIDLGDTDLGQFELFGGGLQHSISQYMAEDFPIDLAVGGFYQVFTIGDDLVDSKSIHLNVTGSYGHPIFRPYVGVGFDSFKMESKYDSDVLEEPIEVDFDRETNAHFTVGLLLKLAVVHIHGEFNAAAENGFAVGLGFGN